MNRSSLLFCCIISLLLACQPEAPEPEFIRSLDLQLNPSGHNPLGALLEVEGAVPSRLDIIVKGKYGEASDVQASFDSLLSIHRVPILGLYPESNNQVVLIFKDNTNQTMASDTINIETGAILADLPQIQIDISRPARMSPGMNLVSYFGYSERFLPLRPFMFDAFGDIRWYLDYSQNPVMSDLFYDTGVNRLQNGNLFFGNANNDSIYEVDMLGHTLNTWGLSGYHFHHMVIEKPDGNLVVTVTDPQKPTVEDVIIELDRETGNIVRTWDLTQSLDPARRAWPTDLADLEVDWFHANALAIDYDGYLIVSGRTQGTVKLRDDNEVVWIIAPHREWGLAGDGTNLRDKLLQALDRLGNPITDQTVLDGESAHPDFDWAWYQHSPAVMGVRRLFLFDNGDNRHYQGLGPDSYSRGVLYEIDESEMTIQQVWEYGQENGGAGFSRVVSKIGYARDRDNVLLSPGAVNHNGETYGLVQEVDLQTETVYFQARVFPPTPAFGFLTFHNSQRLTLYP